MPVRARAIGLRWASLLLLFACRGDPDEPRACGAVACADDLALTLRTPDDSWPAGHYVFEFSYDDQQHTCTIDLPDAFPMDPAISVRLPCEPPLEASFSSQLICSEERVGGGVTQQCTPVRDHRVLRTHKRGAPELLRVRVTRDAKSILEASERPEYEAMSPNGPGCGPVCELSQLELRLH